MKIFSCLAAVFSLTLLVVQVQAQNYPAKPITLIVPYAPGGGTDISARVIAQQVSKSIGQPIIIENKPGAGTLIGTSVAAKASADGYTLVYGSVTHTIAPALYGSKMPFDAVKDFTPITQTASFPFVVVVQASSGINSMKELIAAMKEKPGTFNYASVGNGTGTHLSGELLKKLTGTDMVHVPYKGSGPALTALLGGQVQLAISDTPPAIPHLKSGALKALAVTTPNRASTLPDIPTIMETGVQGFEFTSWWGVLAPANLPPSITEKLQREFAKALQHPDVKARLASFSADPVGNTSTEFGELIKSDVAKFDKIVKSSNIKLD